MSHVLINRRRLLVSDRFVLPDDSRRTLYEVIGNEPTTGLVLRPYKGGWYGYLHMESGVVTGSEIGGEVRELLKIPNSVMMRESDVK